VYTSTNISNAMDIKFMIKLMYLLFSVKYSVNNFELEFSVLQVKCS